MDNDRKSKIQGVTHDIKYRFVVIGASAGGGRALSEVLSILPSYYGLPILVAQHLHPSDDGGFAKQLDRETALSVVTPVDKQKMEPGNVYVAPANYHLLVERNGTMALSTEERVNWSRPSIDVLFDSAAHAFGKKVTAILLSGASADGTEGIRNVKDSGGLTVVQEPATARHSVMPQSAINAGVIDRVLPLKNIGELLIEIGTRTVDYTKESPLKHDR